MKIGEILARVKELATELVQVTGGEPLIQESTPELLAALADAGHTVLLETGGHKDIRSVDPRVIRIVDIKCPSSGECAGNLWSNLRYLRLNDEVKLVIADREDYEWARDAVREHRLEKRSHVIFSPVFGQMDPSVLASWMQEDMLSVRLGLQIHKYIWGPDARGV
jgi:7-carboxy-7-deazaguanine synthase